MTGATATAGRPVLRHRTAIGRATLSIGARSALADGLLTGPVLDYGCGRGDDVGALRALGVDVVGWDPFYAPDAHVRDASVVLLTYVVNTIEDVDERLETVRRAWSLAGDALAVTARLTWERDRVAGEPLSDGTLTARSTFQHLFATRELVDLVARGTGARPVVAQPGIVYAFRSEQARLTHLLRRYAADDAATATVETARDATEFLERRGRLPGPRDDVRWPTRGVRSVARRAADPALVDAARVRMTVDTLFFLSIERFHGRPAWAALPPVVQGDVEAFFGSYKHACWRADRLLRQLRDLSLLRRTMRGSVGKLTPTALYVHRRALRRLPLLLRVYEECGAIAAGRPPEWDVVKLHHDAHAVSWLGYPEFDADPHPVLHASHRVRLDTLDVTHTEYAAVANRPLLHRKHEFLAPDDARAPLYERLTRAEVAAGLYEHPERIGTQDGWAAELERCGRALRGHRLVRRPAATC